jgi:hypothetical protein
MAAQPVAHDGVGHPASDGGQDAADRRGATVEVLLHAADEVVRERLHHLRGLRATAQRHIAGGLLAGHRVQHADGVALLRAAGDLRGADDRRVLGHVRERGLVAHPAVELWRAADAPGIERAQAGRVAAEHATHAAEAERAGAGNEEGSLLRVVCLERAQVEGRRVHLHLAEVRVQRRVQRQVGREQHLDVAAGGQARGLAVVVGVARRRIGERAARHDVRHELHLSWLARNGQPLQPAVERRSARRVLAPERPHVVLVPPVDVAPDLEPPRLHGVPGKAQLAVGNADLGGPAHGVHVRDRLPDRVPRRVAVELLTPHARRIHLEAGVVQVVVVRVQVDDQLVGGQRVERPVVAARVQQLIPPGQRRHDAARLLHARPDVQCAVAVEDAHLRRQRGGRTLIGLVLAEVGDGLRPAPRGLVEPAVDADRAIRRRRLRGGRRVRPLRRRRLSRRLRASGERKQDELHQNQRKPRIGAGRWCGHQGPAPARSERSGSSHWTDRFGIWL